MSWYTNEEACRLRCWSHVRTHKPCLRENAFAVVMVMTSRLGKGSLRRPNNRQLSPVDFSTTAPRVVSQSAQKCLNRFVVPTLWQPFLSNELTVRRNRTVSAALARPVLLERDRTLPPPQARLLHAPHPTPADPTFQFILSKMPKDAKVRVSREIAKICGTAADPPAQNSLPCARRHVAANSGFRGLC